MKAISLCVVLLMLGACTLPPVAATIAGVAAGGTTTMLNAPKVWDEVQGWVDPSALVMPPQPGVVP